MPARRSTTSANDHDAATQAAQDLVHLLPQPAAIIDHRGLMLEVNRPLSALAGQRTLRGNFADMLHEDDRQGFLALLLATAMEASAQRMFTARMLAPGSDEMSVRLILSPTPTVAGRYLLQLLDLTKVMAGAYHELQDREQRWHKALLSTTTGVWDHNFRTGEMYYSDTWRTIRGLTAEDALPETDEAWLAIIHPDDRERVRHALERQTAGDPDYMSFEYRERRKDGQYIWIECRGACDEWDDNGRPARIIGTDVDITARKNAEEAMQRLSQRLELALQTSKIGIFEVDLHSGDIDWDDGLMAVYGLEGSGRNLQKGLWENLLHPDDRSRTISISNAIPEVPDIRSTEFRIIRASDGAVRHIRSHATIFLDQNNLKRILGVEWDITDDVDMHRKLKDARQLADERNIELETSRKRIKHVALHDHLTGLPNRRQLDRVIEEMARKSESQGHALGVLHIDLDRFKQINDSFGHEIGDALLQHAAKTLVHNTAEGDFVARIGGDEFVIVCGNAGGRRKLSALADRIISDMRAPVELLGQTCRFGASIGISMARGTTIDARTALIQADTALFHAKNGGRNRHVFFSSEKQVVAVATKRIADDVLRGLDAKEFEPYYQFQFCARSLDVAGVEALARWIHPEDGLKAPDYFLKIAEDIDVVGRIDALILQKSLRDHKSWTLAGHEVPKLSVNVSGRRLQDPDLKKALKALKVQPGVLSFELLESIFLDDPDTQTMDNLEEFRRRGISIELDDFGTGHTSIVSLLRLQPDRLKIDRQLVRRLPESVEQQKLVGAIIEIGHSLDVEVVAEGVETAEHIRILQDLNCDILQGYGLCRPMPFLQSCDFLRTQPWR